MGLSDLLGDVYGEEPEDERPSDAPLALEEITLAPPSPPVAAAPPPPVAPAPAPEPAPVPSVAEAPPPPVAVTPPPPPSVAPAPPSPAPPPPFAESAPPPVASAAAPPPPPVAVTPPPAPPVAPPPVAVTPPTPVAPPPPVAAPPPPPPPTATLPTSVEVGSTAPPITATESTHDLGLVEPSAESSLPGDATPPGGGDTSILPEWSSDEALDVAFSDWEPIDAADDFESDLGTAEALMAPEAVGAPESRSKRRGRFSFGGKRREKNAPAPTRHEPEDDVMDRPESVELSGEPALGLDAGTLDDLPHLDTDSELALEALLGPDAEDEVPARGTRRGGLRKNKKERGAPSRKAAPAPEAAAHDLAQTSWSGAVALLDDDLLPRKRKR